MENSTGKTVCLFCYKISNGTEKNENFRVNKFANFLERFTSHCCPRGNGEGKIRTCNNGIIYCCKLCRLIVDKFCDDYHQLKYLEMKMEWKLERLVGVMEIAGRIPSRWNKLQQLFQTPNLSSGITPNTLENLRACRQNILERCNKRLSSRQPRLLLKRVCTKESIIKMTPISSLAEPCVLDNGQRPSQPTSSDIDNKIKVENGTESSDVEDHENFDGDLGDEDETKFEEMALPRKVIVRVKIIDPDDPLIPVAIKSEPGENNECRGEDAAFGPDDKIPCQQCNKAFSNKERLRDHLRKVHVTPRFQCPTCKKLFKTNHNLNAHCNKLKHSTPKACQIFQCTKCQESFSTKFLLNSHIFQIHNLFRCTECDQEFHSRFKRTQHLIDIHKYSSSILTCDKCDRKFPCQSALTEHQLSTHKLGKPIQCSECGKFFQTKNRLAIHTKFLHDRGNYLCPICKKNFKNKSYLKSHMKIHDQSGKANEAKCKFCYAKFQSRFHLGHHVKLKHVNTGDVGVSALFKCSKCDSRFLTKRLLGSHTRRLHKTGWNPCFKCGKNFLTKVRLTEHTRQVHALGLHVRVEHEDVEESELFKCSGCNSQFLNKLLLQAHVREVHTTTVKYQCTKCGKEFKNKSGLDKHKVIHEKKKKQCNECGEMLATRSFQGHMRVFHKKGCFICRFCGKYFPNKVDMKNHLWIVHKNKDDPCLHMSDYSQSGQTNISSCDGKSCGFEQDRSTWVSVGNKCGSDHAFLEPKVEHEHTDPLE